jgi:site-specific DNA recombinase
MAAPGPDFRWGVVLRRSKLDPDGTEESTDRQEYEIVHYIRDNDMGVIVQSYKDIASGWTPGVPRPRFKHALVDLASGMIDGIAVLNIDRLTRRKDQVRPILNALEEMGGRLFSLEDNLDTADDDPDGSAELKLQQLVERAEREARRTSQRMKLMAKHRARKGLHQPGSKRPFGHTPDWCNLVPHEVQLIREAAGRVVAGDSIHAICRDWTRRGISTTTGVTFWRNDKLTYILRSARLVGKREYYGTLIDLPDVPAILPEQLWQQVCEKLAPKRRRAGRRESRLLSNIAVCGICGFTLIGDVDSDRDTRTYVCKRRPAEPGACGGINVTAARAEARVNEEVVVFLNDWRRVEALLEQHRLSGPERDALDARYAELQDNKMVLEEAAFNPPAGVSRLPRERYWELRRQIDQEQDQLQRMRAVSREVQPLKAVMKRTWTEESWLAQPLEWRRAILHLVTECIEVAPDPGHGGGKKGAMGGTFNPDRVIVKFAA